MVRTLHLEAWPGQYVAVDRLTDQVVASAASFTELVEELDRREIVGVTIMRAPDPDAPIRFGLG